MADLKEWLANLPQEQREETLKINGHRHVGGADATPDPHIRNSAGDWPHVGNVVFGPPPPIVKPWGEEEELESPGHLKDIIEALEARNFERVNDPRRQSEHDEQVKLFEWAALNTGRFPELEYLHAVPNGGHRHPGVAVKLKAEGVKAGVWDVNLDCARHGYHGLKIEMKAGKNTLTDNQQRWGAFYETQGYKTAVCYGWVEAAQVIMEYLGKGETE